MALWELNTEVLRSLWLMTTATWGISLQLKASMIREGEPCPFELYSGICLTTEEKNGKPQSV
jgi:hypothetical protein